MEAPTEAEIRERDEEYLKFRSFLAAQKSATEGAEETPSLSQCEALRKQGNDLFNLGIYENAVAAYTEALALAETDEDRGKLYSNRSAAYLKCEEEDCRIESVDDARQAVSLLPEWPKSYLRLASGLLALGQYEESIDIIQKGSSLGMSGTARLLKEARKGIFDTRVRNKVFLQHLKGLDVRWKFEPPQTMQIELMDHSIKGQYHLISENLLRVSSQEDGKSSQDYEFEFRNEELWIKSKKDNDFLLLKVVEDVSATELTYKDEEEYLNAWLQMLPEPEEGARSVAIETDSKEVIEQKSIDRMYLIQELSKIQKRGQDLHLPAMESIRNRKGNMCKELHRRMVALGLMEPERIEVDKVETKSTNNQAEVDPLESPTRCCSSPSSGERIKESMEVGDLAEEQGEAKSVFLASSPGDADGDSNSLVDRDTKAMTRMDTMVTDERFFGEADDEGGDPQEEDQENESHRSTGSDRLSPHELAQVQDDELLQRPCASAHITSVLPPEVLEHHKHAMETMESHHGSNEGGQDNADCGVTGGDVAARPIKQGIVRNALAQCFQGFAKACGRH